MGTAQKWYDPAHRPKEVQKEWIGRYWRADHVHGDLGPGWHFVTFALPPEHKSKQAFLHFGSVDGDAQVHLNGKLLGRHDGDNAEGWTEPFHFDLSKLVKAGRNDLAIRVTASTGVIGVYKAISVVVK